MAEELELPAFAECERCGEWYPIEELIMVSAWGGEPKITCARCLLHFLGGFLHEKRVAL
jgi:hypothetical protein